MTAFSRLASAVRLGLESKPLVRSINFHNTARANLAEFDRQLGHCAKHFHTVNEDDVGRYLATGVWERSKPGMLLAFYEGYRNNYDVIVPLLEKHGLTGWFFVICGFIDCPIPEQLNYAEAHSIDMGTREYPDGRYAMTWDELRSMDKRHVIASHALSHQTIATMGPAERRAEIIGSQELLIRHLGHPARAFVSFGGPAYGEHPPSDALIDEAGYQFVVSNYRIQRLRDQEGSGPQRTTGA